MHTTNNDQAKKIIETLLERDPFCNWLGIELLHIEAGFSRISMKIRPEMLNALGVVHGGISYALADSAFAYACNNQNNMSLALENSINYVQPVHEGDELTAEAKELHSGKSTGVYLVTVFNQHHRTVAVFKGTCFKTGKPII